MPGIAPKLPLQTSSIDGYALTKTLKETMKQNFKMLVLTSPGERMMDPDYGVGLRNYLFEQSVTTTHSSLTSAIHNQAQIYMPFLSINNVSFPESENPHVLNVSILYSIPNINVRDVLELNIATD
jgi:phage baseplate assembly protein W